MAKPVKLFYDVLSPYSWVGFEALCRCRQKWNIDLQLKPFLLGAVMVSSGNKLPGPISPAKARHMIKDLYHLSQYHQIPFIFRDVNISKLIKKGSMSAQRLLTASNMISPQYTEDITRALYLRIFNKNEDITTTESLLQACQSAGVPNGEELVAMITQQNVKDQLKAVTQEALDYGAYGSPTMVTLGPDDEEHMLFGSDRIHILAMLIGEKYEGPLNELAKTKL